MWRLWLLLSLLACACAAAESAYPVPLPLPPLLGDAREVQASGGWPMEKRLLGRLPSLTSPTDEGDVMAGLGGVSLKDLLAKMRDSRR